MSQQNNIPLACVELALANIAVGVMVVTGKFLVASFPIFTLLWLRFLVGTLTFAPPVLTAWKQNPNLFKQSRRDWGLLFLQGIAGALTFNLLLLYGLKHSTAMSAGIITSTTAAFTAILAFFLLKEKIGRRTMMAILVSVLGVMLINLSSVHAANTGLHLFGNTLVLLAVASGALYTILIKATGGRVPPTLMSLMFNFFAVLMFTPLFIWDMSHVPLHLVSKSVWGLVFLYGVAGSVLFPLLWSRGIEKVSASTASLFAGVMPISTILMAWMFLGEKMHMGETLGMICILAAIAIDVYRKKEPKTANA